MEVRFLHPIIICTGDCDGWDANLAINLRTFELALCMVTAVNDLCLPMTPSVERRSQGNPAPWVCMPRSAVRANSSRRILYDRTPKAAR
jgi:hypothetical protein